MLEHHLPPTGPSPASSYQLSLDERAAYERDGFLIRRQVFPQEQIAGVIQCAEQMVTVGLGLSVGTHLVHGSVFVIKDMNGQKSIGRIAWAGAMEPTLLNLSRSPEVLRPVRDLLYHQEDPPFRADHLINALHIKLPGDQVFFPWHQDIRHRLALDPRWQDVNGRGSFVQTMLALDPMTAQNGAVIMIAGSHKFGNLDIRYVTDTGVLQKEVLPMQISDLTPVLVELDPGDLVFFHPYVVHGSNPNVEGARRLSLVSGFSYPGANQAQYPGEGSGATILLP